jgi:hypothetical protein
MNDVRETGVAGWVAGSSPAMTTEGAVLSEDSVACAIEAVPTPQRSGVRSQVASVAVAWFTDVVPEIGSVTAVAILAVPFGPRLNLVSPMRNEPFLIST